MEADDLRYRVADNREVITEEEKPRFDELKQLLSECARELSYRGDYISVEPDQFRDPKTWIARLDGTQRTAARPYDSLSLLGEEVRMNIAMRLAKLRNLAKRLDVLLGEPSVPAKKEE